MVLSRYLLQLQTKGASFSAAFLNPLAWELPITTFLLALMDFPVPPQCLVLSWSRKAGMPLIATVREPAAAFQVLGPQQSM
jgi:hypothetical protein